MAYSKLNLKNGQKLNQDHLAHIEAGIAANEAELTKKAAKSDIPDVSNLQPKGDYALKKEIPDVSNLQPKGDYALKSELPSTSGFATEEFVVNKIAEAELNDKEVNLSGYYTKSEVDSKIANIKHPTIDLSGYVTDEELLEAVGNIKIPSTEGLASETYVDNAIANIEHPTVDLEPYAKKTDLPSLEGLATESYVDNKVAGLVNAAPETLDTLGEVAAALAENQDVVEALNASIGNKANKDEIPSIEGLASETYVDEAIAGIEHPTVDLSNYALKEEIPSVDGLVTEKYVNDVIVGVNTELAKKAAKSDIPDVSNLQPKGNYLTEHQKLKTINGHSIAGEGNIQVAAQTKTGFEGKVVSVLGDSISAMQGYIPVEDGFNLPHQHQYPTAFGVDNMWWKIVIDRLGAKLGICDAWDGTTVRNTATTDTVSTKSGPNCYIGSSTRLVNLGSNGTPDMILIFAGTNDTRSGTASSIGTFDASVEYVPMTEDEVYNNITSNVLAEAYATLIRKLQYLYPTTKLVALAPMYGRPFALYPQARMMSLKAIRDVCDYFGVLLIDPIKAGLNINNTYGGNTTYLKDGIHPNKDGMKLIGDYVYKQICNTFEVNEGENVVYPVINRLDTLTTNKPHVKGVSKGTTYTAKLSGTTDFTGVKVYMGISDVTGSSLAADGTITITNVSGAIVIADKDIEPPTIQTYSVTFEENGGSAVSDLTGQTELPNPLPTTTRSGYTFGGWYTNNGLTEAANPGVTLTANVTLYAKWTEIVEPDDGDDEGNVGAGGTVDPASVNWYVDYTTAGGNFKYTSSFPGFVFADNSTASAMQGVPIDAVKVLPAAAGDMELYKVTGTSVSDMVRDSEPIATFTIAESDVIATGPADDSNAKAYRLGKTITLANNERLHIKAAGAGGRNAAIYVSTTNKPSGSSVITGTPTSGSSATGNAEGWCGSVGYGCIQDPSTNPPDAKKYSVTFEENGGSAVSDLTNVTALPTLLPEATREGFTFDGWFIDAGLTTKAIGGSVLASNIILYAKWTAIEASRPIDPTSITWYADNSGQTGKNFNYNENFPGAAVGLPAEDAELLRGVPINVVKFVPSAAGKMFFAKWVPDNAPVLAATVDIPENDVGANTADAKIYPLSNTVTLADNEYLICGWNDSSTTDDTGGFWVNAGSSERFKAYVLNPGNTIKAEHWGIPFGFGYQE